MRREYTSTVMTSKETQTLSDLCNSSVDKEDRLSKSIQIAAATVLSNIQKQFPYNQISRCVVLFPDGKPVDETIEEYNRFRLPEDKENTAFLLPGPGVKTLLPNPGQRGEGLSMVYAKGTYHLLPDHWKKSYKVKKSITLEKGQKLIGVPLTPEARLANDFYIGLKRTSNPHDLNENSLIDSSTPGILMAGLSTAPVFLSTLDKQNSKPLTFDSELISFKLNSESYNLDIQPEKNIINIFNNELIQLTWQTISASINKSLLYFGETSDKTLFNIKGNRFFSYNSQSNIKSSVLLISDTDSNNSEYALRNATLLKLEGNHFFGECKRNLINGVRTNSENYFVHNNLFECWMNGNDAADLNAPISDNFRDSDNSNRIFRYISDKDENGFKWLPDANFLSDSMPSDTKHHRRRYSREAEQSDNKKSDNKKSDSLSNKNKPSTAAYIGLGISVFALGVAGIVLTCNFLTQRQVRELRSQLNDLYRQQRTPQPQRQMSQHTYHLLPTQQPGFPGQGCQSVTLQPQVHAPRVQAYTPHRLLPVAEAPVTTNQGASTSTSTPTEARSPEARFCIETKKAYFTTKQDYDKYVKECADESDQIDE
ncbi:hypothetical protein NX722_04375 [Endozoicomonas gorgoniicola]|uniref:Right-handed parallel beta-helix repeat-containing protein n=1 Tax=Endozoicomonas gorgoniicola TaxID=1234144 RepID=A0ABT3MR92_9GAMM|nr:hypothetical protein [Endozoicomonas gorgoniicola]MCW7551889.1 hypothetical protein [Endozoicomonas gorgoniicola]